MISAALRPGASQMFGKRAGERAERSGLSFQRHVAGIGGVGDQQPGRAFADASLRRRRLLDYADGREAARDRYAARIAGQALRGGCQLRIVAARIHENESDPGLAADRVDDHVEGKRADGGADLLHIEVDRHNVVDRMLLLDAVGLKSVAGIEEETDVGSLEGGAEPLRQGFQFALAGVLADDHLIAQSPQHLGHLLRVVERLLQRADAGIGGVADDKRDPFFWRRQARNGAHRHSQRGGQDQQHHPQHEVALPTGPGHTSWTEQYARKRRRG